MSTRFDRMCELNVVEQVANVCQSSIVQNAWKMGQELHVHGWCYSIENGHITDLKRTVSNAERVDTAVKQYVIAWRITVIKKRA